MAERALPRLTRLLGIVTYLEDHGEATFAELAEHFVSREGDQARRRHAVGVRPSRARPERPPRLRLWAFDEGIARLTNSQGVARCGSRRARPSR